MISQSFYSILLLSLSLSPDCRFCNTTTFSSSFALLVLVFPCRSMVICLSFLAAKGYSFPSFLLKILRLLTFYFLQFYYVSDCSLLMSIHRLFWIVLSLYWYCWVQPENVFQKYIAIRVIKCWHLHDHEPHFVAENTSGELDSVWLQVCHRPGYGNNYTGLERRKNVLLISKIPLMLSSINVVQSSTFTAKLYFSLNQIW